MPKITVTALNGDSLDFEFSAMEPWQINVGERKCAVNSNVQSLLDELFSETYAALVSDNPAFLTD